LANQNANLGIQEFTQNPNFNKFQNFQSGREVNENLLGVRQQDLANAANAYTEQSRQALSDLASQQGRFGLLRENFGGDRNPQYTTGQQRLDEIFFAREGLGGLRSDVQNQLNTAQDYQKSANTALSDVRNLASQEQQLIGDINSQSSDNASAYVDMLNRLVPELNQQRNQEWENLNRTTNSYIPSTDGLIFLMKTEEFKMPQLWAIRTLVEMVTTA